MPIRLCRIDDRLIHGQVVLGWARALAIADIVLVDDEVAASSWEQDLYRMAVPPELRVEFVDTATARERLAGWQAGSDAVLILTGNIQTMVRLLAGVPHPPAVNLGGIHHRDGRTERLPYLYLTDEELAELRRLRAAGIEVSAEDVPGAGAVRLEGLP
ncbi:MAG TPA: PTS sugar transporter subunit IIB [Gemmatimonadales bacterium]|nr:PTS sugar transporter subunit IIB [Gemmatimonadales bacterium]